jgi:hypothetical protein
MPPDRLCFNGYGRDDELTPAARARYLRAERYNGCKGTLARQIIRAGEGPAMRSEGGQRQSDGTPTKRG